MYNYTEVRRLYIDRVLNEDMAIGVVKQLEAFSHFILTDAYFMAIIHSGKQSCKI